MKRLTIFCGSSAGNEPYLEQQAYHTGKLLAEQNIGVVYGGACIGLMGAVANGALEAGGEVIGVIPEFLKTVEVAHPNVTEMIVVDNMHQRKAKMNELSDGAIALPGGFGTMEELFEMLTWAQLGLHTKPIGLVNVNGFYDALVSLIDNMVAKSFLKPVYKNMLLVSDDVQTLLERMKNYKAPEGVKKIKTGDISDLT